MIIRYFKNSDLDRILDFKQESVKVSFPTCEVDHTSFRNNILKAEPGSVLVAEDKNEILGYIYLKTKKTSTGLYGIIHHIFVDPEHRGRGLASKLMERGEEYFIKKGLKKIRATITFKNEPSLKLAKKFGYKDKRIIMEKDLD